MQGPVIRSEHCLLFVGVVLQDPSSSVSGKGKPFYAATAVLLVFNGVFGAVNIRNSALGDQGNAERLTNPMAVPVDLELSRRSSTV